MDSVKFLGVLYMFKYMLPQQFRGPDTEYPLVADIVKIAIFTPMTNAWPERGASPIKRIKIRLRSRVKNLFNRLLIFSVDGPDYGSAEARTILGKAAKRWTAAWCNKCSTIYWLSQETVVKSVETQTNASVDIIVIESKEKADKMLAAIDYENLSSENWITKFHVGDLSDLRDDTDIGADTDTLK